MKNGYWLVSVMHGKAAPKINACHGPKGKKGCWKGGEGGQLTIFPFDRRARGPNNPFHKSGLIIGL